MESERLRRQFEHWFKKRYDGRYHTAKMLEESAWSQRVCYACQIVWGNFWIYKSMSIHRRFANFQRSLMYHCQGKMKFDNTDPKNLVEQVKSEPDIFEELHD